VTCLSLIKCYISAHLHIKMFNFLKCAKVCKNEHMQNCFLSDNFLTENNTGNMQKTVKISCDKIVKVSLEKMFKTTFKRHMYGRWGYLGQRVGQLGTVDDIYVCSSLVRMMYENWFSNYCNCY